jgi:hypothetical protein
MAGLDIAALLKSMAGAAAGVLGSKWPGVKSFANTEFNKIAHTIQSIQAQVASGEIQQDQAALLLDMQKNASRAVIASVQGMDLVMAEQALNAALAAVKSVVNTFVGFSLIA